MDELIPFLFFLFVLLTLVTLIGHGIWVFLAWFFAQFSGGRQETSVSISPGNKPATHDCINCGYSLLIHMKFCGACGAQRLTLKQAEQLRELDITLRQSDRLYQSGALDEVNFQVFKTRIELEREHLIFPRGRTGVAHQASLFTPTSQPQPAPKPVVVEQTRPSPPSVTAIPFEASPAGPPAPQFAEWSKDSDKAPPLAPPLKPPSKPFAEILASFMEQSNIRWGEIIGGILIIGCSTALVISLWAQISRVPVMKFFIFTTVTAALFGVGFYTEHHWKLPTTSRGILTIATLLVPLNFLAIAAVSSGTAPGALVIGSELIAPAIFLCLVYFAGRVITPGWPHLLAAGALGSSAGQLLIRHFAAPEISASLLLALGAFPVLCYVVASGWMLKAALADGEIDETEANALFTALGALTFAAVLPFGLLLHKSGSVSLSMMHLAPLVTLAGTPLFAGGMLLWHRVEKKLAITRTAGASIAIMGMALALGGMILAWPNPASIVPAALFNFLLFTAGAVLLKEPRIHVFAAGCLTFAYVVGFHVIAGHVPWENLRVVSLLQVTNSVTTGQSLLIPFVAFAVIYEWWNSRRERDAFSYLLSSCGVAILSLILLSIHGLGVPGDPYHVSVILAVYAAGSFWFAWREKFAGLTWTGAALLLFTSAQISHSLFSVRLPWQASFLLFAAICTAGALVARQFGKAEVERLLVAPLQKAATVGAFAAAGFILGLLIWRGFQPTELFAIHIFILAAIFLGLLVLTQSVQFFTAFQIALTFGAISLTTAYLQRFEWFVARPNGWLHPWALQVQGSVLGLMCLAFVVIRIVARKLESARPDRETTEKHLAMRILDMPLAFDHLLAGALVAGLVALSVFGAASGVSLELTNAARTAPVFDLAGFPHGLIFGLGSFAVLATLLAVMVTNLRERGSYVFALGALLVLWTLCPLLAGRCESQFATASAARWSLSLFLLLISVAYAFGRKFTLKRSSRDFDTTRLAIISLTIVPLLLLTLSPVLDFINYVPARGPQGGIFGAMSGIVLYGAPLIVAATALGIHAVSRRSAVFAFAAGLFVNFTVTAAHIVSVAQLNGPMNRAVLVTSLQLNALAAATFGLLWVITRRWWMGHIDAPDRSEKVLLTCQRFMAIGLNAALLIPVAFHLIAFPQHSGSGTFAAGGLLGWPALLLTIALAIALDKLFRKPLTAGGLAAELLAMASIIAFGMAQFGVAKWLGFHVLLATLMLIAWLLHLARQLPRKRFIADTFSDIGLSFDAEWPRDSERFAAAVGAATVLVALRSPFSDPLGAWWSIAALLIMSALAASLNWVTFRRVYLYAAGILVNISVSIWLIKYHSEGGNLGAFIETNLIVLCLTSVLWLWLELRARHAKPETESGAAASFHHIAAIVSLLALGSVVAVRLLNDFSGVNQTLYPLLDGLAFTSLTGFMAACLWDRKARYAVAGLYLTGLLAAPMLLHHVRPTSQHLLWGLMMAGAIQALVSAVAWRARESVINFTSRLKIPPRIDPDADRLAWLLVFNGFIVCLLFVVGLFIDLRFAELTLRLIAALAVMAQAVTFALLAQGASRITLRRAAVTAFLAGAVLFGWSWLDPGTTGTWLHRAVILMTFMFVTVAVFGLELHKLIAREPDWTRAVRDCVPAITATGIIALAFVLCTEIYYQIEFGAVHVSMLAVATVAITLAAATVVCIVFAVAPQHDPLGLSERTRGTYAYVAETLLFLLFMHIRLTMPWLFSGFFQRYWPLVVLAIAYAGVALSELLRRRKVNVLAIPIERTGAFLPLLPVIGFWIAQSQVEYSTLLFVVGGLYGLLSILRKSFWFGLAAAMAGNGGLWYLLHETSDYRFYQHPQLWLIPAAVSVLIAAHLNRKDFSEAQMTGIRYLCLVTIYVSSTADIFVNGIAQSPSLPLILAGLSVAGVFCGIIFRIRAFLLLGSIFLLLSIATMINYASVNFHWTWLWYVAGIVTGALIIATFAIFEKKRADVLRVVDGFKDWKA
jgi:hypothetical protein